MDELFQIISEAFGSAQFTVEAQENGSDFYKNASVYYAVVRPKKTEMSKSIWLDLDKTAASFTCTAAVRCYGRRGSFDDAVRLMERVYTAVAALREGVMLSYLDIGELTREASLDRLRCDVLFTAKGWQSFPPDEEDDEG